ncbi:hypothetical protein [Bacillus sp. FJAT-27445]|uniref:hypothetical protein n=1 Tax=Bacillus sp. FJAT-27445 TaxID=1679166 RepID=UPI000743AC7C|nr:hypothetical protein [Bacillus sp. FJAT-27445]
MLKFLVFVLLPITLVLLAIFAQELFELHKQEKEEKKSLVREGMEGYLDQLFGYRNAKVFKVVYDADGNERYMVYFPSYAWFKEPTYKWYEVYQVQNGYRHSEITK